MSSFLALVFVVVALASLIRWAYRKFAKPEPDADWVIKYLNERDEEEGNRERLRSSKYRVERLGASGEGITRTVRYAIWRGSEHVADFAHDFRLDENWFEIGGATLDYNGGDPAVTWERGGPVYLTLDGEARLDRLLGT